MLTDKNQIIEAIHGGAGMRYDHAVRGIVKAGHSLHGNGFDGERISATTAKQVIRELALDSKEYRLVTVYSLKRN